MFEDTQELAENKLLLLYIFDKVKLPLSNTLITEIVLENNLLNYFHLQQYLSELSESNFLYLQKENKKQLYSLTSKGANTLEYFENRISPAKKEIVNSYLSTRAEILKREVQVTADYYPGTENDYIVTCSIIENNSTIIEIKMKADSNEKAKKICSKWKLSAYQTYGEILNMLTY
jgi:hypothetical protein